MAIQLPFKFKPRNYQLPLLKALDNEYKRVIQRWHRRSGKDKVSFNYMVKRAFMEPGQYYYILPTYTQAKKVIWDNIDNDGNKMLDHIPNELIIKRNDSELKIEIKTQYWTKEKPITAIMQLVGSDNFNAIMGTNPKGCVFSEYSLQDPQAWQYIRPILAANGGWAIFNFTPRGENHAYELEQMAIQSDQWYVSVLTVEDTHALPQEVLDQEKQEMLTLTGNDALYQQEYMVSYSAPVEGSYYATQLLNAQSEGRITNIPWEPTIPVHTFWDLGMDDSTTVGFAQFVGKEKRFIDYLESSGEGLEYYIKELKLKPYVYGNHYAPHDIEVRELGTGKSRKEVARSLGIDFKVAPKLGIDEGINAVRSILPTVWFDQTRCQRLIAALKSYHKEWDDKNRVYKKHPQHDWSSHGADMMRYFATSYKPYITEQEQLNALPKENYFNDEGFY